MEEVNYEIGLTQVLRGSPHGLGSVIDNLEKENVGEYSERVD